MADVRYTIQGLLYAYDCTVIHSRQTCPQLTSDLAPLGSTAGIGVLCQAVFGRQRVVLFTWECFESSNSDKENGLLAPES